MALTPNGHIYYTQSAYRYFPRQLRAALTSELFSFHACSNFEVTIVSYHPEVV
jgi:hypothetical protein